MLPHLLTKTESLHGHLGWRRFDLLWAKLQIVTGLTLAGAGISSLFPSPSDMSGLMALLGLAFFVLGAYLALAGQRNHLYLSNNLLAAWIVQTLNEQGRADGANGAKDNS